VKTRAAQRWPRIIGSWQCRYRQWKGRSTKVFFTRIDSMTHVMGQSGIELSGDAVWLEDLSLRAALDQSDPSYDRNIESFLI
jgi:hypothetical protein